MRKVSYYTKHVIIGIVPRFIFRCSIRRLLKRYGKHEYAKLMQRVNYYNQMDKDQLDLSQPIYRPLVKKGNNSSYYYELREITKYFPRSKRFNYVFGDVLDIPQFPAFIKARPINTKNQNSVLMKLDAIRHYRFVKDHIPFKAKKDMAVFRGPCYQKHRQEFIEQTKHMRLCDIGDTRSDQVGFPTYKPFMSRKEQLRYKFIISVEGNDVATNLKWIMSSNSLCFMRKPRRETWFMEGKLIPNKHYVLLADDYSDLPEKIRYYSENTEEAESIIQNAHEYVKPFQDLKREKVIQYLVMQKYFDRTGQ